MGMRSCLGVCFGPLWWCRTDLHPLGGSIAQFIQTLSHLLIVTLHLSAADRSDQVLNEWSVLKTSTHSGIHPYFQLKLITCRIVVTDKTVKKKTISWYIRNNFCSLTFKPQSLLLSFKVKRKFMFPIDNQPSWKQKFGGEQHPEWS